MAKAAGPGKQNEDYCKFAWILGGDGVKVGLWQQPEPAPAMRTVLVAVPFIPLSAGTKRRG